MSFKAFRAWQGSDIQFLIAHKVSADGDALNITGSIGKFLVKDALNDDDSKALISATTENGHNTIVDGPGGLRRAVLPSASTEALTVNVKRTFYCQSATILTTGQVAKSSTFRLILYQGAIKSATEVIPTVEPETPTVDSPVDTSIITTSEIIEAGDFVNIFNTGGGARVRRADASVAGKEAHGFVLAQFLNGLSALVHFEGTNTAVTGVTPGVVYLSASVPGGFSSVPPSGSGNVVQRIGFGVSPIAINFEANTPVTLA